MNLENIQERWKLKKYLDLGFIQSMCGCWIHPSNKSMQAHADTCSLRERLRDIEDKIATDHLEEMWKANRAASNA